MPIRLLLEHDHLFEPEEIDSLILAFENTLRVLGLTNREDPLTVAVAKLIIQLAKDDERDPGRLRDGVLEALGRAATELGTASTNVSSLASWPCTPWNHVFHVASDSWARTAAATLAQRSSAAGVPTVDSPIVR